MTEPRDLPPVELLTWEDTTTTHGWTSLEQIENLHTSKVSQVGYVIHEDDDSLTISGGIASDGDIIATVIIPKSQIRTRRVIQ